MPALWHILQHAQEKQQGCPPWLNQSQIPACAQWQQIPPSQAHGQLGCFAHCSYYCQIPSEGQWPSKGPKKRPSRWWSSLRTWRPGWCFPSEHAAFLHGGHQPCLPAMSSSELQPFLKFLISFFTGIQVWCKPGLQEICNYSSAKLSTPYEVL